MKEFKKTCKILPETCPKCNSSTMSAFLNDEGNYICSICNSGIENRWVDYSKLSEYQGFRLIKLGGRYAKRQRNQRRNRKLRKQLINSEKLHGSAISNAKQHSSHDRIEKAMFASTNEGKNEEMRGMTAPALQLLDVIK